MRNSEGLLVTLETLCKSFPHPIIVKEVGFGLSEKVLTRLKDTGIAAVDVAGKGGPNWARVEQSQIDAYDEFGIPTTEVLQCAVATMPREIPVVRQEG